MLVGVGERDGSMVAGREQGCWEGWGCCICMCLGRELKREDIRDIVWQGVVEGDAVEAGWVCIVYVLCMLCGQSGGCTGATLGQMSREQGKGNILVYHHGLVGVLQ